MAVGVKVCPLVRLPGPPARVYDTAPPAVRLTVWPKQTLVVGTVVDVRTGEAELTITVMLLEAVQLDGEVADKLYTVVTVGDTTIVELVVLPVLQA